MLRKDALIACFGMDWERVFIYEKNKWASVGEKSQNGYINTKQNKERGYSNAACSENNMLSIRRT